MLASHIVRAWKDQEYRMSLTEAEQALLPQHPSGMIEISDDELALIAEEPRTTISTAPFAEY